MSVDGVGLLHWRLDRLRKKKIEGSSNAAQHVQLDVDQDRIVRNFIFLQAFF